MSPWPRAKRSHATRAWRWMVPVAAIALVGCEHDRLPSEPESAPEGQLSAASQAAAVGADDWIVVFKDGTKDPPGLARTLTTEHGGSIKHTYTYAIQGFAGRIPPQAIEGIRHNPNVAFVERDGLMYATAVGSWGLDRIDQRNLPLDDSFLPTGDGTGVEAWILDTGIDYTYPGEFDSRFDEAKDRDFIDNDYDASDCHGHGTHVAGTVGSNTYGVANGVTLIGVRVLDCGGSGSYSAVIAGIDYVAENATLPAVANMSLSGGTSSSINLAIKNAVGAGAVFAVAAGNNNYDACLRSPASAPEALTVASSTSSDSRSSFSNYGSCVDLFAPGSSIYSTLMGGGAGYKSGTSMASPHVAGVAALILGANPTWTPDQVWAAMQANATAGVISDAKGSPNLLLYTEAQGGDPGCGDDCPSLDVSWVSDVTVTMHRGGKARGLVTVQVVDADGPVAGVTVDGSWTIDGTPNAATSSGTTGSDGAVDLQTSWIKGALVFHICVTDLQAPGYDNWSGPLCVQGETGIWTPGGGDPPPNPGADPPINLTGTSTLKGKIYRANLAWESGGPTVTILRGPDPTTMIPVTTIENTGSYTDNLGKTQSFPYTYEVCDAGTDDCSGPVDVGAP